MATAQQRPGVVLVSMPWPLFNRPSIQLATLKAFLEQEGWPCRAYHLYLSLLERIGPQGYYALSQSSWLSEAVGAAALFKEMSGAAESLYRRLAPRHGLKKDYFPRLVAALKETVAAFLASFDPEGILLVGFSVCLNQLTASLYAARSLKAVCPQLKIVFGGSSCAQEMGRSLMAAFPFIDYVVNGEGELPLLGLVRYLAGEEPTPPEGVFYRRSGEILGGGCSQIDDPDRLPVPDFSDYFQDLTALAPSKRFFPIIPLEFSRGCWWGRCRFCNLNLQWRGYRLKSPQRLAEEVIGLSQRLGVLDFALMDNVLPPARAMDFFRLLAKEGRDYHLFCELRARHSLKELREMRQGGLTEVQVGIEALSTSLLRRLNKGTTAMDNVAIMKNAQAAGLRLHGNLITCFPTSTSEEVAETLEALDFVFPFRPLKAVSFWLGYGSPVFSQPKIYGLRRLYPHSFYRYLFPPEILQTLVPLVWGYVGDRRRQQALWRPVVVKARAWAEAYRRLRGQGPLLSYRDGGDFIILRQVLPDGSVHHHRLRGPSRRVYLFLESPQSLEEISARMSLASDRLLAFLKDLVAKRLVFAEGDRFLALAIRGVEGGA
ncbi:RiPP maturation radical SAM protein 1 [Thermosulfuriphilus ammonigenes]|uniref:RiPP maturation radical SAM protein 1 n=1 Tax=Thermosulfuriphilus ammonigenes TaxID=1936021 RepID=A0A6G7PVG6_9BACT|nr:RiPP maturation radical SAM C-methyltransferase [Thermosulfuriphilus ammonigenes]MBA2848150.1 ribosomal peptide maturation radical SAM protein 1 [Thermosulfuriphilus ammonigenes]QIJ71675.1 RiPP maturation radical SAM protein 1 [Thermosulfuriphilus ammonigenes]